jgi:hypothetical protein
MNGYWGEAEDKAKMVAVLSRPSFVAAVEEEASPFDCYRGDRHEERRCCWGLVEVALGMMMLRIRVRSGGDDG